MVDARSATSGKLVGVTPCFRVFTRRKRQIEKRKGALAARFLFGDSNQFASGDSRGAKEDMVGNA